MFAYFNLKRLTLFSILIILLGTVLEFRMRKMRIILMKIFYALLLLPIIHNAGGNVKDFAQALPKKILGWEAVGKDAVYDRRTLYDYMDGGAEVYLAFDFNRVFVRKFAGPVNNEITLDIYDMTSPEEAFGIFSCDREDQEAGIGQESEYGFGLLRFWQGRYFVSIMAMGDEKAAEKVILELGKAVAAQLGPPGSKPALVKCLPEKNLRENRISYFHSHIILNNRFFLASENILNFNRKTECVFAEYQAGETETGCLLLIRYPDERQALAAYRSFLKSYIPDAQKTGEAQMENDKWTKAKVQKNMVAIVFEAVSKQWAEELQSAIKFPQR